MVVGAKQLYCVFQVIIDANVSFKRSSWCSNMKKKISLGIIRIYVYHLRLHLSDKEKVAMSCCIY